MSSMKLNFWLPKAAILHPGGRADLFSLTHQVWGSHHQLLLCTCAAAQPVSHRYIAVPQSGSSFACDSPCHKRAGNHLWWSPSQGCLETQTTGEDLTFRWAALEGKTLWVQPPCVIWSHANVVSNEVIWEVCLGMLKTWLESSKDPIVGPTLQRQISFLRSTKLLSLSILAEVTPLTTWWLC